MKDALFFVFDVESIGLHGEAFAVAGGIYNINETAIHEFAYHCDPSEAKGDESDRNWVSENVSINQISVKVQSPLHVRMKFWNEWIDAKEKNALMFVECGWPVESRFIAACIDDDIKYRKWKGPYPVHEISTVMVCAKMDPMATYLRSEKESPAHEPLADARLSARLLMTAIKSIN